MIRSRRSGAFVLAGVMLVVTALAGWSLVSDGIVAKLTSSELSADAKLEATKRFFLDFGPAAPIVYVVFVTIEVVVAPLPGLMLYAPGGIVFGGFWGGLLSLVGNVLGAVVACGLMRFFGGAIVESFIERKSLQSVAEKLADRGVLLIAMLRVNPLTSSDLVSYAAGITTIPIWKVSVGTALGMAPLCWAQSYLADNLLNAFPRLIYPLVVACVIYIVVVVVVITRMVRAGNAKSGSV